MKVVIVYFSQTGNTEKVVRAIAKGVENTDNTCSLTTLQEVTVEKLKNYDLIGIGTPVFYFQEPWNIRDFIKKLSFLKDKSSFIFCTHGGQDANTLPRMARGLKEKGLLVLGGLSTKGYDSFQPYIEFDYSKGHPDEEDLKEAEGFGQEMVKNYRLVKEENRLDILPDFKFKFSPLHLTSLWLTKERVNRHLPKIEVDKEKCIKCGKCAGICPSGIIELNPYPIRKEDCIRCYYCEKICSQGAIIVNWRPTKRLLSTFRICAWPLRALMKETGKERDKKKPETLSKSKNLK
ncbi:EFR1 family ferrodoxin [bacterium]|nr:EFR1 family ferrodoxin [bacterium]